MRFYETIQVNMSTGSLSYEKVPGFEPDMDKLYRTAAMFVGSGHCPSLETAVRLALNGQYAAFRGLQSLSVGGAK